MIDPLGALLLVAAGIIAGTVNTIVGAGSLLTFPTLLFLGYPPLVANVSNTVGLVPGTISGSIGYRRELAGQRTRARPLLVAAGLGGLTGACLLLVLPASAFARIVPVLILIACALVAVQPRLSAWVLERRARSGAVHAGGGPLLVIGVYLTGIYGGYFGAAQGVILIALLAILVDDDLQRLNGLKNLIAVVINSVAAIIFVFVAPVAWLPAILLAIGSTIGGQLGAVVGRRLSPFVLRWAIILVGTTRRGPAPDRMRWSPDRRGRRGPVPARSVDSGQHDRMTGARRLRSVLGLALAVGLIAASASRPGATDAAAPHLTAWKGGVDLYRAGTFTTQRSWLWCTAADVQIVRNIVDRAHDHSTSGQRGYFNWMRARNRYDLPLSAGVDAAGWTAGLRHFVDSRYRLVSSRTFDEALRSAVTNLRLTNLPVAITVSHGNHGWILTGFRATADPAKTAAFKVTSVRVVGPLYGLQSRNGYDMPPNTKLTPAQLKRFFTPWKYAPRKMIWDGRYVSIQPGPAKGSPWRPLRPRQPRRRVRRARPRGRHGPRRPPPRRSPSRWRRHRSPLRPRAPRSPSRRWPSSRRRHRRGPRAADATPVASPERERVGSGGILSVLGVLLVASGVIAVAMTVRARRLT